MYESVNKFLADMDDLTEINYNTLFDSFISLILKAIDICPSQKSFSKAKKINK